MLSKKKIFEQLRDPKQCAVALNTLTCLDLCRCSKGLNYNLIIQALKDNTTITQLDLSHNRLDDKLIPALAEVIKHNKTLSKIILDGNRFYDAGPLVDALEHNHTLTHLSFDKNHRLLTEEERQDLFIWQDRRPGSLPSSCLGFFAKRRLTNAIDRNEKIQSGEITPQEYKKKPMLSMHDSLAKSS